MASIRGAMREQTLQEAQQRRDKAAQWQVAVSKLFFTYLPVLVYLCCNPPWPRQGLSGERPLRDVTLSSVQDPSALSSSRVVHLVRSQCSVCCSKCLAFVHSFHIRWYTNPVLYNSDAVEIPPLVQPPMLHFQVGGVSCASCCSRTVIRFPEPGGVVKPGTGDPDPDPVIFVADPASFRVTSKEFFGKCSLKITRISTVTQKQCWGSGSVWASRIRIHLSEVWIRIRSFTHKGVERTEVKLEKQNCTEKF